MNPAEIRAANAASFALAALVAQQVAGRTTRDTLFLTYFDVERLPLVLIAAGLVGGASVLGVSWLMTLHSPMRLVRWALAVSAVSLVGEWALSLAYPRVATLVIYAHMAVFGASVVSALWSVINERFDPHTARQVVGRIGIGASVGGALGGGLTWGLSTAIPVATMLLFMAGALLVALAGVVAMSTPALAASPDAPKEGQPTLASGIFALRASPYLRQLAVIVGVSAAMEALLDYVLNAEAKAAFAAPAGLVAFFSAYHMSVAFFGLAVQASAVRASLRVVGIAGAVASKPGAVVVTALIGAFAPHLWTATLARAVPAILHHSIFRSAYELLYTPVSIRRKRPAKAVIDVGVDKLGTAVGASITLAAIAVAPESTSRILLATAALLALCALAVCRGVHRAYVGALEEKLRAGTVQLEPEEILDSITHLTVADATSAASHSSGVSSSTANSSRPAAPRSETTADPLLALVADLRSTDSRVVRRALRSERMPPEVVGHIVPLLGRDDVAREALRALRRVDGVAGQLVDALLDTDRPVAIRRRMPRVLRRESSPRAVEGLLSGLADEVFDVRYECGLALARMAERGRLDVPAARIYDAALLDLGENAPSRWREHVFNLLAVIHDKEPLRNAYWALESETTLRGTALEYLENVLPGEVCSALWKRLGIAHAPGPSDGSTE